MVKKTQFLLICIIGLQISIFCIPSKADFDYYLGFGKELKDVELETIFVSEPELVDIFGKSWYRDTDYIENTWHMKFNITKVELDRKTDIALLNVSYWGWRIDDFTDAIPQLRNWEMSIDPEEGLLPEMLLFTNEQIKVFYLVPTPVDNFLKEVAGVLTEQSENDNNTRTPDKEYSSEGNTLIMKSKSNENGEPYILETEYNPELGVISNIKMKKDSENQDLMFEIDASINLDPVLNVIAQIAIVASLASIVSLIIIFWQRKKKALIEGTRPQEINPEMVVNTPLKID